MAELKATKVPDSVKRTTLDGELEAWLKSGCPSLGGHMPVEEMRREHQTLVPEKKVEVQVRLRRTWSQGSTPDMLNARALQMHISSRLARAFQSDLG